MRTDPESKRGARPLFAMFILLAGLSVVGLATGYRTHRTTQRVADDSHEGHNQDAPAFVESARWLEGERLDLNRATQDDLQLLPGVGPTLAARILEDRQRRGAYRTVEELTRVPGIGPRKVEAIRRLATVKADPSADAGRR